MKLKTTLVILLVFVLLVGLGSLLVQSVQGAEVVDGYLWEDVNRDTKTGIILGAAASTNWFMKFMGEDGLEMNYDMARNMSFIIDDMYETHFPKWYSIMDVISESGNIDF